MNTYEQPHIGPHVAVRKLYRSTTERHLGGVCGGVAEYTNTDPTVVRVVFIVLAVMGPGVLLYPLLWAMVPEQPWAPPAMPGTVPDATPPTMT